MLVFIFECFLRILLLVTLLEGADAPVVDPERYRIAETNFVGIVVGFDADTVLQVRLQRGLRKHGAEESSSRLHPLLVFLGLLGPGVRVGL